MGEILAGEATPVADRRLRRRAARQGRDHRGGDRPGRRDVRPVDPDLGARPAARRGRHRRRPVDVGEHLHDGRDRGRRRGRAGGQARQPVGVLEVRLAPTCSRRSASGSTCRPTGSPRSPSEAGITFCFAAAFHPAMRHAAVPRRELGHRHHLQLPRPAGEPGPTRPPRRSAAPTARMAPVMAGVFAAAGRRRLGVPRRRRPRRAHHHDHVVGVDGPRRRGQRGDASTPPTLGLAPATAGGAARRRRRAQRRRSCAACSTASRARCATPYCSTRRRRWPSTTRPGAAGRRGARGRPGQGPGGRRLRRRPGDAGALGRGVACSA